MNITKDLLTIRIDSRRKQYINFLEKEIHTVNPGIHFDLSLAMSENSLADVLTETRYGV